MSKKKSYRLAAATLSIAMGGFIAFASSAEAEAGKKGHGHEDQHMDNKADSHTGQDKKSEHTGSAADVSRTILVITKDSEFDPQKIQVKEGETIRFVVWNTGQLVHEFTIGTPEVQKAHQVEMQKMMDAGHLMMDKVKGGMEHSHGNSALVEPGQGKEVIWTFAKGEALEFGCNVPGHYEAGMKGEFVVGSST